MNSRERILTALNHELPDRLPIDLGEGLILRRSQPSDRDALVEFNSRIHGQPDKPDQGVAVWTADLFNGNHPTFGVGDFTIVPYFWICSVASAQSA